MSLAEQRRRQGLSMKGYKAEEYLQQVLSLLKVLRGSEPIIVKERTPFCDPEELVPEK